MNSVRRALLPILMTCAAKAGDLDSIKTLIKQGANLNEPSDYDGKTSLHLACAEGHSEVVQLLLKNGASAYVRDRRGRTPLFEAIRYVILFDVIMLFPLEVRITQIKIQVCFFEKSNSCQRFFE